MMESCAGLSPSPSSSPLAVLAKCQARSAPENIPKFSIGCVGEMEFDAAQSRVRRASKQMDWTNRLVSSVGRRMPDFDPGQVEEPTPDIRYQST